MNPLLIGPLFEFGKSILDRFIPDPEKKLEAEMEMFKMVQAGDLQKVIGQLEVNAKEAQHTSIFVAGWRPWCGWIGGFGLGYAAIFQYLFGWLAAIYGFPPPPPIDTDLLIYVLGGLLGLGGLRTVEKVKGVAS
jgi:hypothetical protein